MQKLLSGVVLDDDPKPVRAAACEAVSEFHLRLTLTEGKYHQVKRMVAAVSNRVEGLHRSQIGGLRLPDDLAPGQWKWLTAADLATIARLTHYKTGKTLTFLPLRPQVTLGGCLEVGFL